MKKKLGWISYFIVCAIVIAFAVDAGRKHGYCYECEIASGHKNASVKITGWEKFINAAAGKKKEFITTVAR